MEIHRYSRSSLAHLDQCEPELKEVAILALKYSQHDLAIIDSLRTPEQQRQLLEEGKTTTLRSRHLPNVKGLSEAFDFVPYLSGRGTVFSLPDNEQAGYFRLAVQAMFRAAIEVGVQIESGGLWRTFSDYPHIQLRERKT